MSPPTNSHKRRFRSLLESEEVEYLMEAHNGLSARIVEEAGFAGIWASGLSISAALGVRDCNEASWTQTLEVVEFMRDAAPSTPILLDGDTGFGNFNNVRRLVKKLEQRDIDGVCLEDKLFPKKNSFVEGPQRLAAPEEFAGKIMAAKDTQVDPDFCVVARLEGFIAGLEMDEVLDRADRYAEAGADAILVHSKREDPGEVLAFAREWDRDCPLVIVPTTYADTPNEVFIDAGFSVVIWANHLMRASITAMQEACRFVRESGSVHGLLPRIASMSEVFRLQRAEELAAAERRYLPSVKPGEPIDSRLTGNRQSLDPADVILPD